MASIAFVLRFFPNLRKVVEEIQIFRKNASVREFRRIIKDLFQGEERRGYRMLEPYFNQWGVSKGRIREEIDVTFAPLLGDG